jgi:tRNA A37 methylthiotransferase MiaB
VRVLFHTFGCKANQIFPFSPKDGTTASALPNPVPQRIAGERSCELRALAQKKHRRYRASRAGKPSVVTLEAQGRRALTRDYLRVDVEGVGVEDCGRLHSGVLRGGGDELYIELYAASAKSVSAASGMESPLPSDVSSA